MAKVDLKDSLLRVILIYFAQGKFTSTWSGLTVLNTSRLFRISGEGSHRCFISKYFI